jgi:hypothetical protein
MTVEPRGPGDGTIPTRIAALDRQRASLESQIAMLKAEVLVNLADRERLFLRAEELGITEDLAYRIVKTAVGNGNVQIAVVRR